MIPSSLLDVLLLRLRPRRGREAIAELIETCGDYVAESCSNLRVCEHRGP